MPGGQQCVPVQFFAGSPRLHNLTALLVLFEKPGDEAPGKQVLRCRELIFRCPVVLASPSDDAEAVLVVVPRAFSLFPTLAEMRARVLGERPAGPDDFACCLRYTLQAKLAPQWNVVGELLLQGRDFLQVTGPVNGVRLQVNVTEEDVCLSAQACVVRLPPLRLSDLGASPVALVDFNARLTDVISESQLTGRWCHILPRMTKGQVATVTRHLPPSGPFAAYRDLKRHWKNMYGYRLPEEEPAHYVNVNFRLVGPQLFTYPPLCLRNGSPVFLARPAPRPILTALLRDLHVKVGSVCGQPLSFSGTPSYLTVQLQPAPTFQPDCRPNVSSEPSGRQPPPAVRRVGQVTETGPVDGGRPGTAAQARLVDGGRPGTVAQPQARVGGLATSTPQQQQQHRQQKQPQQPKQQQPRQQQQPPEQHQQQQTPKQQQPRQQQQPRPQQPQQQPRPKQQQLKQPLLPAVIRRLRHLL
ncbi:uncharacterized protein C18orf63-like [Amphibalanus amphitrite]|uniref:uncharacterized protein C18orf63-like n=1 Tax=Amphibalanus amphitrite TaxID=1232801 RepID=UPI001C8FB440|nr:uncharacterized protein C18orf63-like [Amphibalanus amphitrite]